MRLWTSNFAKAASTPNAISIANSAPKWFKGKRYKKLCPPYDLVTQYKNGALTFEEFSLQYRKILAKLDPVNVSQSMGNEAVMLCWEKAGDFCHRHLVAEWMRNAGIEVAELQNNQVPEKKPDKKVKLNKTQGRIRNLWELRSTYPVEHNQYEKITNNILMYARKLSKDELKQIEDVVGVRILG